MPTPLFSAIIFDFDGLILETETPQYQAWRNAFNQRGCELPIDFWISILGRKAGSSDLFGMLADQSGQPVDPEALQAEITKQTSKLIQNETALPGVEGLIIDAKEHDLKLGVASGSTRPWVTGHLQNLNLLQHFDHITTNEDTDEHKPLPAPFLECASQLNVEPSQCLVLEDSPNGIDAAKAAGMFAVAVPTTMTEGQPFNNAALRLETLKDANVESLSQLLSGIDPLLDEKGR